VALWQHSSEAKLCHSSNAVTCHLNSKMARKLDNGLRRGTIPHKFVLCQLSSDPRSPHILFAYAISLPPHLPISSTRLNTRTTTPLTLPPLLLKRHPLSPQSNRNSVKSCNSLMGIKARDSFCAIIVGVEIQKGL
jgi:hypothetical protein